jgi:hypothetical protein
MINILKTISTYTTTASSLHNSAPPPPLPEPQKENREILRKRAVVKINCVFIHTYLFKHEFENNERKPKIVAPSGHNDMGERYRAKRQAAEADFYIGLILRQS